jgi:uncharacterized protein
MSNNSTIQFLSSQRISLNKSSVHGLGVFATKDFKEGDLIERCPMVKLGWRSKYVNDPVLLEYLYMQPKCDCSDCTNHGHIMWMVLGYGMMYNHQDIPNTQWRFHYEDSYADVVATKDIKSGEEIFVTYGNHYFKNRKKVDATKLPEPKNKIDESILADDDETFMAKMNELMKASS